MTEWITKYDHRAEELEDEWYELDASDRAEFAAQEDKLIDIWMDKNHEQISQYDEEIFNALDDSQRLALAQDWAETDLGQEAIRKSKLIREAYVERMLDDER